MKKLCCFVLSLIIFFGFFQININADSAKSYVVINGDTKEILLAKNSNMPLPMASTTKIMTALLICCYGNLKETVNVSPLGIGVEGTSLGLKAGDKITLEDLLYGMMLTSGNDAANTAAIHIGKSIDGFVSLMNNKAKELCLKDTVFETPSGLDKGEHHTTALDLAIITKKAMEYEAFRKAVCSKSATIRFGNPPIEHRITNHNRLLKEYDDIIGVKTGYTKKSGRCLVSAAKKGGKYVIAVTLNDPDDWDDHRELIDKAYEKLSPVVLEKQTVKIPIVGGNQTFAEIKIAKKEFFTYDLKIKTEIFLPKFLYSPTVEGEKIGLVKYCADDTVLAQESIEFNNKISHNEDSKSMFKEILLCILRSINERQ